MKIEGKCLCGKVRFTMEAESEGGMCHCKMCRRWGGGLPYAGAHGTVLIESEETLRWWKSSPWGERGFCGECGSSLFWRSPGNDKWVVSIGALEDESSLKLSRHIYIDEKSSFYNLSDEAPKQTGLEFAVETMEMLGSQFGEEFLSKALKQMRSYSGDAFTDKVERLINSGRSSER